METPRRSPLDLPPETFRELGHALVDRLADHLARLPDLPVTRDETPAVVRAALGNDPLPETGSDPADLLRETFALLEPHLNYNGHPRFFGYITASSAPLGALGDLLAAGLNPNLGGWVLSPMACEIELQTIRWIASFLGCPAGTGGLLTSGGNMANLVAFWAARRHRLGPDVRTRGMVAAGSPRVYASRETHTWIQKAADLTGLGTDAVHWIDPDASGRLDVGALEAAVREDRAAGHTPFFVVGTAGTVGTGAVDPLPAMADLAAREDLWFHVDGAYGAPAAAVAAVDDDLRGLARADSVAVDPHKWLYAPLEAGCVLVRDPNHLRDAFSYRPPYFPDEDTREGEPGIMFHEYGPQNSRGFRALKVWLALRQIGAAGYRELIAGDIGLARELHDLAAAHPRLEAVTHSLSITTYRYLPRTGSDDPERVDAFNRELLARITASGEAFLSHAVLGGRFLLRACVVNFRTRSADMARLVETTVRLGEALEAEEGGTPRQGERPR